MNAQLFIYKNQDSSNYELVELYDDEPINVTFEVLDLKSLDKRGSMYSKTFTVPGTKNNNIIFGELFNISADYTKFDPRNNYKCELRDESFSVVIKGVIKLDAINKTVDSDPEGNLIEYEVEIHDSRSDLFSIISERYITDIDLYSKFDHTLTRDNIVATWSNTSDDCYTYPKYYKTSTMEMTDWHPAFFVKYLVDRIIGDAGFTYDCNLFESDMFKHLIIPWTGGKQMVSAGDLLDNRFAVGLYNSNQIGYSNAGTNAYNYMSNGLHWGVITFGWYEDGSSLLPYSSVQVGCYQQGAFNIPLTRETAYPNFYDNSNLWNSQDISLTPEPGGTTTYLVDGCYFEPTVAGKYHFVFSAYSIVNANSDLLDEPNTAPSFVIAGIARIRNGVYQYINSSAFEIGADDVANGTRRYVPTTYANKIKYLPAGSYDEFVDTCFSDMIVHDAEIDVLIGDKYYVYYRFENNIAYTISTAQWPAEAFLLEDTAKLTVELMNGVMAENQTVVLSDFLPKDLKQSDLLSDLCKMFNLYIITDGERDNHIIFKTADEFYGNDYVDWTEKLDYDIPIKISFLPDIIPGRMKFTYAEHADEWNESYKDETNEVFGEYTKDLWYSSTRTEENVELKFAPTPMVSVNTNTEKNTTMAIDAVDPKGKLRILSYSYPQNGDFTWRYTAGGSLDVFSFSVYPFAGHYDVPAGPTNDLNFGETQYDFFDNYQNNATDANLYNKYYSSYFRMIGEGKLVTAYFYLNSEDIHNLDLRKKVFVSDNYYYINSIQDYNCTKVGTTKVELIKINEGIEFHRKINFKPIVSKLNAGDLIKVRANIDSKLASKNNDFATNAISVTGIDNLTDFDTENITIHGIGNKVYNNSKNIRFYNADYNEIQSDTKNVVLINTSGHTATTNYTTYINDIEIFGGTISADVISANTIFASAGVSRPYSLVTSNTFLDSSYYVVACSGNTTICLPDSTSFLGMQFHIKKIDDGTTLTIVTTDAQTIDGDTSLIVNSVYTNVNVFSDGSNWLIL